MNLKQLNKFLLRLLVAASAGAIWTTVQAQTILTPAAIGNKYVTDALGARANTNLALASAGSVAFESSEIAAGYSAPRVNDGYNNGGANSWIPANGSAGQYVGVAFASAKTVGAVIIGGQYGGRGNVSWIIQYTTNAIPSSTTNWTSIGVCARPTTEIMMRTGFEFPALANVTGIRIVLTNNLYLNEPDIQELEVYPPSAVFVSTHMPPLLTPVATGLAPVVTGINGRSNLVLAAYGGSAFASSQIAAPYYPSLVIDGNMNNEANAYIPLTIATNEYVAVVLWSNNVVGSIMMAGEYGGRSAGVYQIDYTTNASPGTSLSPSNWTTVAAYYYPGSIMPASLFDLPVPITNATALRMVFVGNGQQNQLSIQEFGVYAPLPIPPYITNQPAGGTVMVGDDFTFTVVGVLASTYQWRKDGANIPGANSSSYSLINLQTNAAGAYTVVLANQFGSVTSTPPAVLTVTDQVVYANYQAAVFAGNPIHYYPLNDTDTNALTAADLGSQAYLPGNIYGGVALGQSGPGGGLGTSFHFDGNSGTFVDLGTFDPGTGSITVEAWVNLDSDARNSWNAIVGRLNGSYELDFANASFGGFIGVSTNGAGGSSYSATAAQRGVWHYVVGVFTATGVVKGFVDGVAAPSQVVGGILASAGPTVKIGATRDGLNTSFNFKGHINQVAFYDHELSHGDIQAHLAATGLQTAPPSITSQPVGGSVVAGDDFQFTVASQGSSLTYQWYKGAVVIPGATASSYSLLDVKINDAGSYWVVIANTYGAVTNATAAVLTVNPAPVYASYTNAVLADGPIHYYPLNETSGTTAADLGSQNFGGGIYTGGYALGQVTPSVKMGTCVHFDGQPGTYVNLGAGSSFYPGTANITVEAWAKLDSDARTSYNSICSRYPGSFELYYSAANYGTFLGINGTPTVGVAVSSSPSLTGGWHHLVGIFTNGLITTYVDGVASPVVNIGGSLQNVGPALDQALIAANNDGTNGSLNFKGYLSQVAIYDHALSPVSIRAHFRALAAMPQELTIQPGASVMTWPTFPSGYLLQYAASPGGPYQNVPGVVYRVGQTNMMFVPQTAGLFYQLNKP